MAADGVVVAVDGSRVAVAVASVCVHGDTPGAVDLARAVRAALTAAGLDVAPSPADPRASTLPGMPKQIAPFLMFTGQAEEAMTFYTSLFDDGRIEDLTRHGAEGPGFEETVPARPVRPRPARSSSAPTAPRCTSSRSPRRSPSGW